VTARLLAADASFHDLRGRYLPSFDRAAVKNQYTVRL
jgi:hypothetical protein